jgi:hypothetical protein
MALPTTWSSLLPALVGAGLEEDVPELLLEELPLPLLPPPQPRDTARIENPSAATDMDLQGLSKIYLTLL